MQTMSDTEFKARLDGVMQQVDDDRSAVVIMRQNGNPVVLMSLNDFNAYEETDYLLRSPKNAERLYRAIADIEAGKTQEHALIDL